MPIIAPARALLSRYGARACAGAMVLAALVDRSALACSCGPGMLGEQMREIRSAAVQYRNANGRYPVTDEVSTWFEKLRDAGLADGIIFVEAGLPLDFYGYPLVYELPADALAGAAGEAGWPVVRSVGRNGRDDQGAQDDWDLRFGPKWGHWYKAGWPQAVMLAPPVAMMISILVWCARGRAGRLVLPLFLWGWGAALIGSIANPMAARGSSSLAVWAELTLFAAVVAGLSGGVGLFARMISWLCKLDARRVAERAGQCQSCRYDLRGSTSPVCPECGEPRIAPP